MLKKLTLKNSDAEVILDEVIFDKLSTDPGIVSLGLLNGLRLHSAGYAVFQKGIKNADNKVRVQTVYLHKYIAELFLSKPIDTNEKFSVQIVNDNKLDCRLENLRWAKVSDIARRHKAYGKTGYRGVYEYGKNFKALIYIDRVPTTIGVYALPEEAAAAFNEKASEIYGSDAQLNTVGQPVSAEERFQRSPIANYNDKLKKRNRKTKSD